MFGKKKLYKIVYDDFLRKTTIITARNEHQALKKFKKETQCFGKVPSIICFEECKLNR